MSNDGLFRDFLDKGDKRKTLEGRFMYIDYNTVSFDKALNSAIVGFMKEKVFQKIISLVSKDDGLFIYQNYFYLWIGEI